MARHLALWMVAAAGCGGGTIDDTAGGDPSLVCASVAISDPEGQPDPCDVSACEACADACDEDCMILESYPPQYACAGVGTWSVYDTCPDWDLPEATMCDDTTTVVAPDEKTPLGFSADDVIAPIVFPIAREAAWVAEEGRPDTTISISAAPNGDPVFHDREVAASGSFGADPQCNDQLEVPVLLSFSSADGAFAESVATSLWAEQLGSLSASAALDWQDLAGDFTFATLDPAEWDTVTLDLSTLVVPELSGQIQVSASRDLPNGSGEGLVGPLLRWPPQP